MAAPAADAVAADCDSLDLSDDEALLNSNLFAPGIRRMGAFDAAAALAAPHPLLLHNLGNHFPTGLARDAYAAVKAEKLLRQEPARLPEEQLVNWLAR